MAFKHTWKITKLQALAEHQGNQNVVYGIHYSITTEKEGSTYKVTQHLSCPCDTNDIVEFIPFDQLTEDVVIGWVKEIINKKSDPIYNADGSVKFDSNGLPVFSAPYFYDIARDQEQLGENQLEEMINPSRIELALPWDNQ